jgi:hypothetical protein
MCVCSSNSSEIVKAMKGEAAAATADRRVAFRTASARFTSARDGGDARTQPTRATRRAHDAQVKVFVGLDEASVWRLPLLLLKSKRGSRRTAASSNC